MNHLAFHIQKKGYLIYPTIQSHGWINLTPAQNIEHGFRYSSCLDGTIPLTIEVQNCNRDIKCTTDKILSAKQKNTLKKVVSRMLCFDFPANKFNKVCEKQKKPRYIELVNSGWGRIFRSPMPWEDAVKTLCTTNASWPYTQKMCANLCFELGEITDSGAKTFPLPQAILWGRRSLLKKRIGMGYRIKSLISLAEKAVSNSHWLMKGTLPSESELYSEIRSWHGFGNYATEHLMVLLGYYKYLPIDREVALHLGARTRQDRKIPRIKDYSEWGDFRFIAYKLSRIIKKQNWIGD